MRFRDCAVAVFTAVWLLAGSKPLLGAAFTPPDTIDVPTLTAPPAMNGALDRSWATAANAALATDFNYHGPASEPTKVSIAQEPTALDVAFEVTQREALTQVQATNSSSVTSDDYVGVYLYPRGTVGFQYAFYANPRGTTYQTSSENSLYTPQWRAATRVTATGYIVTMRIPLAVIRSGGATTWRAQFVRATVATNALAVWTYSPRAQNAGDPAFAGTLLNVGVHSTSRPKPRAQIYSLGELTTPAYGGSTSRIGADLSLPVTPTASFVGSFHPDYSNVEIDQQTIAPQAFAYQYSEVRPFFTQATSAFNYNFSCSDCPLLLYTPSIPTYRQGYAIEGTQGPVTFGAFDAVGKDRIDQGQAYNYNLETTENYFSANFQRVAVDTNTGVHDVLDSFQGGISNQKTHFFIYDNTAFERGSSVTIPGQADYLEYGLGYASATTVAVINAQRIGAQFNPPDSFVPQTDLTGYELFGKKIWNFSPKSMFHDIQFQAFDARYHNSEGQTDQTDASANLSVDLRDLVTVRINRAANSATVADGELLPFDFNTFYLGYKVNTNTPSYVRYAFGQYFHGRLDAWNYVSTIPLRKRLNLSLETDEDKYLTRYPGESVTTQWLERATLDWQLSSVASFDVGARRIVGGFLPNAYVAPPFGSVSAGNVTLAFHFLDKRNEFYVVYGDPNSLATTPAVYFKWIRYIGASKGT